MKASERQRSRLSLQSHPFDPPFNIASSVTGESSNSAGSRFGAPRHIVKTIPSSVAEEYMFEPHDKHSALSKFCLNAAEPGLWRTLPSIRYRIWNHQQRTVFFAIGPLRTTHKPVNQLRLRIIWGWRACEEYCKSFDDPCSAQSALPLSLETSVGTSIGTLGIV